MGHPKTAADWIRRLGLVPHPEGGFYRETYRSQGNISRESLPVGMDGDRSYGTAIYFLLSAGQVSRWHRIRSDELWFYHAGSPSGGDNDQTRWIRAEVESGSGPQCGPNPPCHGSC